MPGRLSINSRLKTSNNERSLCERLESTCLNIVILMNGDATKSEVWIQ